MRLPRRSRGEKGAALTEFVFIVPLLALIVAGVFEFGLAWRDSLTVSNALRSGARVGSNAGDDRLADYTILKSLEAALREVSSVQIQRIVIYKATTSNSAVPATCAAGTSVSGSCNVYDAADLALTSADFTGTTSCSSGAPDAAWCPLDRENSQALGADYLGVWIRIRHNWVTGFFPPAGTGLTMEDEAIMRLEPRVD
jgi:Flp pilus assembly protein TadG